MPLVQVIHQDYDPPCDIQEMQVRYLSLMKSETIGTVIVIIYADYTLSIVDELTLFYML